MHVGPDTFFLRMAGAGTAPRFVDGALVCADPDEPARDGRFDMVRDAETGESTGRRFALEDGRRVLRALVLGWPDVPVDVGNETMILGVVVYQGERV